MEPGWDKLLASKLRALELTQEQIGAVIGEVAEQRERADRIGYCRGFDSGVDYQKKMKGTEMSSKYRVRWVNFNYYSQDEFTNIDDAVKHVEKGGFEAAIELNGEIVANKTTFGGWEILPKKPVPRSFTELREGDVVMFDGMFRTVKNILKKNRWGTKVEFVELAGDVVFDGLVFTKG